MDEKTDVRIYEQTDIKKIKDIQTDKQYQADIQIRQKGARASKDILQTQTETGSANIAARNGWMDGDGLIDTQTERQIDYQTDMYLILQPQTHVRV